MLGSLLDLGLMNNRFPLQMQYLGSKSRIAKWIITEIQHSFPQCSKLFDVFSGTGAVATEAFGRGFQVSANDLEAYSYCVSKSLLSPIGDQIDCVIKQLTKLEDEDVLIRGDRESFKDYFNQENQFFHMPNNHPSSWKEYAAFCEGTPIIDGTELRIEELRRERKWNLFSHYYANTYFGIKQCLQLDAIREFAEKQEATMSNHILAATISAMTYGVSSTTHLAQYLRPSSELGTLHLIKRRQYDFLAEVRRRLISLKSTKRPQTAANVYNLDCLEALRRENLNPDWVVYADPPYFKEHYSRYYHVLNTFYHYDYPYLTFNPRINRTTEGRYRKERNASDFGKKARVKGAFQKLFELCAENKCRLVLSYAETSLVKKDAILTISEKAGLACSIKEKQLMHSSQGRYSNKIVTEYLFLFQPI